MDRASVHLSGRPPTERQLYALQLVAEWITRHGRSPTLREIGARMGIRSTNGASDHLACLERKGLIRRQEMLSRAIEITEKGWAMLGVKIGHCPMCGQQKPRKAG